MTDTPFTFKKSLALGTLSTQISATEQGYGPLKGLGHTADQSVAVFKIGVPPAADKKVRLITKIGGADPTPAGHSKVAEGKVFVVGIITDVVAVRPN